MRHEGIPQTLQNRCKESESRTMMESIRGLARQYRYTWEGIWVVSMLSHCSRLPICSSHPLVHLMNLGLLRLNRATTPLSVHGLSSLPILQWDAAVYIQGRDMTVGGYHPEICGRTNISQTLGRLGWLWFGQRTKAMRDAWRKENHVFERHLQSGTDGRRFP